MNPLSHNPTKTVGLCDDVNINRTTDFIGEFHPSHLKEFAEAILEYFGTDIPNDPYDPDVGYVVYLFSRKSEDPKKTARFLAAAMEYNDDMMVVVTGVDCDDLEGKL